MFKYLPFALIMLLICGMDVYGQGRVPVAAAPVDGVSVEAMLRVRDFIGTGNRATVKTPVFNTSAGRGARSPQDWQMLLLEYDVHVAWIDELNVQFVALSMIRDAETGANRYSLYRKNVRYIDVEGGRDRKRRADAFLHPVAIKRFGPVVATVAVVTINGQVVAAPEDKASNLPLPERWWENPLVLDSPATTIRDGYLLDRTETPWAFINYDDAEFVR